MTERWYRALQGVYLLTGLYVESNAMLHVFLIVVALEAITNFRIPLLISRARFGAGSVDFGRGYNHLVLRIDSERMLRVVVIVLLTLAIVLYPEILWFLPWFVAAMLLLAGITNICPMVMMFQAAGLR
ncbi:MAG: DUF2892 domain-containing protein [Gammaproteobacteria bacterium]|jgi:hypothetical protein